MLIDTHAHLHMLETYQGVQPYGQDQEAVIERATAAGITEIITVGTDETDSAAAVELAQNHDNIWASVGLHPHDAKFSQRALDQIKTLASNPKVMAIGECGLDYYYDHSPREEQQTALSAQIELALELNKPLIFHVREAFDDFFAIIANYKGVRGVVHSFTGDGATLNKVLDHGFYVGYNGIMTFTKEPGQLEAAKNCPLDRILLETDSPFLSPAPNRGQRNEPANVKIVAEFLAKLRDEEFEALSAATTKNTENLFVID